MNAPMKENYVNVKNESIDRSPTQDYLLRKAAVLDIIDSWKSGEFLEIGIGTGSMTHNFLERGFHGTGYDLTTQTLLTAQRNLSSHIRRIRLIKKLNRDNLNRRVDFLLAFEVLEYVDADLDMLKKWSTYLKPGGDILVSVPARMKHFRVEDKNLGRVRRYEKKELHDLLENAGYADISIVSYGAPLMNVSRRIDTWLHNSDAKIGESKPNSELKNRVQGGINKVCSTNIASKLASEPVVLPFTKLQRLFYKLDMGIGYLATGRKAVNS